MLKMGWSGYAGWGAWLACAGCMPLDDLSSYSTEAEAAAAADGEDDTAPSAGDPGLLADAGAPGAADIDDAGDPPALSLDAGAPIMDDSTSETDRGSTSAPGGSESDAGASVELPPDTLVGQSRQTLEVSGVERSFIYYAPDGLDPDVPAPVLIVAHDREQTASDMAAITGYDAIADRERFVVLYPEGRGSTPWNVSGGVCPSSSEVMARTGGDDSAFIDAMLAFVAADRRIDSEHVFMSGLGSGAALAHEVACRRSDIRAIAAHSGGARDLQGCNAAPKPVLILHGTADPVVPPSCAVEAHDRWQQHNGCANETDTVEVRGGLCDVSRSCPADGRVAICAFVGLGSGWAGGAAQAATYLDFASAAELSWRFFERHAW